MPTPQAEQGRFCISDEEVLKLTEYAIAVEKHYSAHVGHDIPMDMEWAKDGVTCELFVIQARPETVVS